METEGLRKPSCCWWSSLDNLGLSSWTVWCNGVWNYHNFHKWVFPQGLEGSAFNRLFAARNGIHTYVLVCWPMVCKHCGLAGVLFIFNIRMYVHTCVCWCWPAKAIIFLCKFVHAAAYIHTCVRTYIWSIHFCISISKWYSTYLHTFYIDIIYENCTQLFYRFLLLYLYTDYMQGRECHSGHSGHGRTNFWLNLKKILNNFCLRRE